MYMNIQMFDSTWYMVHTHESSTLDFGCNPHTAGGSAARGEVSGAYEGQQRTPGPGHCCLHLPEERDLQKVPTGVKLYIYWPMYMYMYMYMGMRDAEGRKKEQSNTVHPRQSLFQRKNEQPRVGLEPTTLSE